MPETDQSSRLSETSKYPVDFSAWNPDSPVSRLSLYDQRTKQLQQRRADVMSDFLRDPEVRATMRQSGLQISIEGGESFGRLILGQEEPVNSLVELIDNLRPRVDQALGLSPEQVGPAERLVGWLEDLTRLNHDSFN